MRVQPAVLDSPEALGEAAAAVVVEGLAAARARGADAYLLGCPTGRSPATTYAALARRVAAERVDVSRLVVVLMDEYLVPRRPQDDDGGLVLEDPAALHSCARYGREEVLEPLQRAAGTRRGPADDALWLPDPDDPAAYDRRIADAGGVDLFLLASGASDGHVAFNAPGTPPDAVTRVVELPESTRRDNLDTWPSLGGDLAAVPRHGVSVGVATIRDLSRSVLMLCHGAGKREAVARLTAAERYDPSWPATVLADCAAPRFLVDGAAAGRAQPASAFA
ncbi:6-phosphogluconolactonase [Quadrisphaera sp. KR29]|uniref:6-phosphogluconolactonase n=1 Tax=Quadrisphaera sp. KR29 TaxID=3461391 RepID=UPI004044127C